MALTSDFTGKHALVFGGTTGRSKPQGGLQRRKRRPNDHKPAGTSIRVLRRDRLGGLIREYAQVAQGETIPGNVRLAL